MKITLPSNGKEIEARPIWQLELDGIEPKDIGDFYYRMPTIEGKTVKVKMSFKEPPPKPESEYDPGKPFTSEWEKWNNYQAYYEYVTHQLLRRDLLFERMQNTEYHILNECVRKEDIVHVQEQEDVRAVCEAVVLKTVDAAEIDRVMSDVLGASFSGQNVFKVMEMVSETTKGKVKYNLQTLEIKLMNELGVKSEDDLLEWFKMNETSRAFMIVSQYVHEWIGYLEMKAREK